MSAFGGEFNRSLQHRAEISPLEFRRLRFLAGVYTFRAIIPRTLHTIDSSSYGSVCQEQLIYSQWACGRKGLACEGLAKEPRVKNLL
jgi:hypothetical protein